MPLRIGEPFAGYRVLRLLGSGGMGEVYLVQHPRLPRRDALKVLRTDVSSDKSFRERFIREADLAAGLRHPHIVGIHDRGDHDGQLWIAMDYIDGTDAAQLIQQRYPAGMPADLAIPIITAVASALDYAHRKGLLHRDVKPANIIVSDLDGDDRSVSLADFGIARPLDDISGITTTNMTVGTVAYAAPEQLMGEEMDGRVDQYALAATAYHLLTGSQLFSHSNPAVVISRHLNTTPPTLGDRRPDCADLDDVLQIALAKNAADRFPSCSAFAEALADASTRPGGASANATTQEARSSVAGLWDMYLDLRDDMTEALAELAQMPLLDLLAEDLQAAVGDPGSDSWAELTTLSRAEVSQATGMLVAQLQVEPAVALVRRRARLCHRPKPHRRRPRHPGSPTTLGGQLMRAHRMPDTSSDADGR